MINQAIILAGGLGTRLKNVISEIPKPMAPINSIPFLDYLFRYLKNQGITNIILSVGYKNEIIKEYFKDEFLGIKIKYAIELEPLGTGGGIKLATQFIDNNDFFLLNGDTFFNVDLRALEEIHILYKSELTLSLKPLNDFDRYGTVKTDGDKISSFEEKSYKQAGLINGGVYVLNKKIFESVNKEKFSFEKDIMEKYVKSKNFYGYISDTYFIDIGIPEDYSKAQVDFRKLNL